MPQPIKIQSRTLLPESGKIALVLNRPLEADDQAWLREQRIAGTAPPYATPSVAAEAVESPADQAALAAMSDDATFVIDFDDAAPNEDIVAESLLFDALLTSMRQKREAADTKAARKQAARQARDNNRAAKLADLSTQLAAAGQGGGPP